MELKLFSTKTKLIRLGEITLLYDRIIRVDIRVPVRQVGENQVLCNVFNKSTGYPFNIKKLSRADLAYRESGMTHQLICPEIKKLVNTCTYLRLSYMQCIKITYHNRNFFWQSKKFKENIHNSIAKNIITAILSIAGTFLLLLIFQKPGSRSNSKPVNTIDSITTRK